ncbi:cytochrome c [Crocinitomicaceae bacterium]|nr:cytochrome c [Crocinitomicaceae bacterium]MDB3906149.1 cytochrome c [Crocinitomicaceae bacterium]
MKYLFIITIGIGSLIACAPKTTEIMTSDSNENGGSTEASNEMVTLSDAAIDTGIKIFQDNCISCHYGRSADNIPKLVDGYSKERWDRVLPEMIENAKLDATQAKDLKQYIYWEIAN